LPTDRPGFQFQAVPRDHQTGKGGRRKEIEQKKPRRKVEFHYSPDTGKNFIYKTGTSYTCVDRQGALDYLAECGYSVTARERGAVSEAVSILTAAQAQPVAWCRSLSGSSPHQRQTDSCD
jgi:hypothetical protein